MVMSIYPWSDISFLPSFLWVEIPISCLSLGVSICFLLRNMSERKLISSVTLTLLHVSLQARFRESPLSISRPTAGLVETHQSGGPHWDQDIRHLPLGFVCFIHAHRPTDECRVKTCFYLFARKMSFSWFISKQEWIPINGIFFSHNESSS